MPTFSKPLLQTTPTGSQHKNKGVLNSCRILYSLTIPFTVCKAWAEDVAGSPAEYCRLLNDFLESEYKLSLNLGSVRLGELLRRECPRIGKKLETLGEIPVLP